MEQRHSNFEIPLEALADGTHRFNFRLEPDFFAAFGGDLIRGGEVSATVEADKVRGNYTLRFRGDGAVEVECDRCLEHFPMPIDFEDELILKFEGLSVREDAEVIYLPVGSEAFDVARLLYEYATLAVPMSHVHEDADLACDPEMLKYLNAQEGQVSKDETEDDSSIADDSPWAALRGFSGSDN